MATKTYTRARVAKAKLLAILEAHETPAEVTTIEVEPGRYTAHAEFAPGTTVDALLTEDLEGFSWSRPAVEAPAEDDSKTVAEVLDAEIAGYRQDAEEEAAQGTPAEEETPAEVENPADVPLPPRKSGYINEVSNFMGVVAYCQTLIPALVEKGMKRKEVIEELRRRGVAYGTARTQYQNWFNPPKPKAVKEE